MIKTILRNITLIYLSLFVFCAGSGINLVYFCCADCAQRGVYHIVKGECDRVHHHDHQHNIACHHHDHCRLLHYSVEDMTVDADVDFMPTLAEHLLSIFDAATIALADIFSTALMHHKTPPLTLEGGRQMLSFIEVLRL